jgi:hypothetical protein
VIMSAARFGVNARSAHFCVMNNHRINSLAAFI